MATMGNRQGPGQQGPRIAYFLYLYGLNRWLKKVAGVDLYTNNVRK
jgi:hypothetical protein